MDVHRTEPARIVEEVFANTPDQTMRRVLKQHNPETEGVKAFTVIQAEHERREENRAAYDQKASQKQAEEERALNELRELTPKLIARLQNARTARAEALTEQEEIREKLAKLKNTAAKAKTITITVASGLTLTAITLPFLFSIHSGIAATFTGASVVVGSIYGRRQSQHYAKRAETKQEAVSRAEHKFKQSDQQEAATLAQLEQLSKIRPSGSEDALG